MAGGDDRGRLRHRPRAGRGLRRAGVLEAGVHRDVEEETADETERAKYVRQLLGAANFEGGALLHVLSGNLGYQVEHHLYPDMPSTRYGEIAPRVREICTR